MKNSFPLVAVAVLLLAGVRPISAQGFFGILEFSALTASSNASDIAMGESFAANPYGISSFTHNPANLMGVTGVNVFYDYRDNEAIDFLDRSRQRGIGATMSTPLGNFGFCYQDFILGRFTAITIENPDIVTSQVEFSDQVFNLSYSRNYSDQLSYGVAVKLYDGDITTVSGPAMAFSSKSAFVFDVGAIYWLPGFVATREVTDHLFFGASLQNFGTDFESKIASQETYAAEQLPRFFRLGFAYRLHARSPGTAFSFKYLLTAEYRRYLNAPDGYDQSNRDFGGLGFKAMFFDIFGIQLGGNYSPYDNFTGQEDKFSLRYGFDLHLALRQFGGDYPIDFVFQYAQVPVNDALWPENGGKPNSLPVFSIQVSYTESILQVVQQ